MNEIITEKNYPIEGLWIFKPILWHLFFLIFFVVPYFLISYRLGKFNLVSEINFYIAIIIGIAIFQFVINILRKANFHYSIGEKFLTLK